ncbi:MAG TPA: hypothetical protein VF808_14990 [Ktedonobacterales bacterium]
MSSSPHDAEERLNAIRNAQVAARRNSNDNGVFYLMWGTGIVIGLAMFDLFAGPVATGIWVTIAALLTVWTSVYMRRQPVRVKFFNHFIWWGFYYAAILVGAIYLFPSRPPFLFTAVGLLAAAPMLVIGLRKRFGARVA